jgi:hypothetical protein
MCTASSSTPESSLLGVDTDVCRGLFNTQVAVIAGALLNTGGCEL